MHWLNPCYFALLAIGAILFYFGPYEKEESGTMDVHRIKSVIAMPIFITWSISCAIIGLFLGFWMTQIISLLLYILLDVAVFEGMKYFYLRKPAQVFRFSIPTFGYHQTIQMPGIEARILEWIKPPKIALPRPARSCIELFQRTIRGTAPPLFA